MGRMMYFSFSALVAVCTFSCAHGALPQPPGEFTLRYPRKVRTEAYPAVGVLLSKRALCTATLIAQDMIVTAAHCVRNDNELQMFIAGDGDSAFLAEKVGVSAESELTDIGFALLTHNLRTKPMLIAEEFPDEGREAVFVGYGGTSVTYSAGKNGQFTKKVNGSGEKHEIRGNFGEFLPFTYSSPTFLVCSGDSGGPVIDAKSGKIVLTASTLYAGVWKNKLAVTQSGFTPAYKYVHLIKTARLIMFYSGGVGG